MAAPPRQAARNCARAVNQTRKAAPPRRIAGANHGSLPERAHARHAGGDQQPRPRSHRSEPRPARARRASPCRSTKAFCAPIARISDSPSENPGQRRLHPALSANRSEAAPCTGANLRGQPEACPGPCPCPIETVDFRHSHPTRHDHGRPFQMGQHPASQGAAGRGALKLFSKLSQGDHRRRQDGRPRSRQEPAPAPGGQGGQGAVDAQGQYRPRDQEGDRRRRARTTRRSATRATARTAWR